MPCYVNALWTRSTTCYGYDLTILTDAIAGSLTGTVCDVNANRDDILQETLYRTIRKFV